MGGTDPILGYLTRRGSRRGPIRRYIRGNGIVRDLTNRVIAATILCWPFVCHAQVTGPASEPRPDAAATPKDPETAPEQWAIHGQTTTTWQLQPAFARPIRGRRASVRPPTGGKRSM